VSKVIVEEGLSVRSLRPLLLLPLVLAAVLLPGSARSAATATQLNVTVGPGFSIKVADANGHTVSNLDPGDYTITVKNLSPTQEHNFHLTGPGGIDMASNFSNVTETWNLTFVDGVYRYVCDAHRTIMHGSFRVGTAPPPPPPPPPAKKLTGKVGPAKAISLKKGANAVKSLVAGKYKLAVSDLTKTDNFHLTGPGVNKKTGVAFKGSKSWTLTLKRGKYTFRSDATKKLRRTFTVR
jgi:plastocyanin